MIPRLTISLFFAIISCSGCAPGRVYVDVSKVPGVGGEVKFPSGKLTPIMVKRVIDGRTIELTNGEIVRYIGVYIPDIGENLKDAKMLNQELLADGDFGFEFDKEERDEENRLLTYIYLKDGRMINEELIRCGVAHALITPPNDKYSHELNAAQKRAQDKGLGIWAK